MRITIEVLDLVIKIIFREVTTSCIPKMTHLRQFVLSLLGGPPLTNLKNAKIILLMFLIEKYMYFSIPFKEVPHPHQLWNFAILKITSIGKTGPIWMKIAWKFAWNRKKLLYSYLGRRGPRSGPRCPLLCLRDFWGLHHLFPEK